MHSYPPLRPHQEEVLSLLKQRKNVFALLPTGSGKSLCYEIPAAIWKWRVLVISPLVSLIEDQFLSMHSRAVEVARLHSLLSREENAQELQRICSGEARLIYISPEKLVHWRQNGFLQKLMEQEPFSLLALDEIHCALDWAEFRTSYQEIGGIVREFASNASILCLSASLIPREADSLFRSWGVSMETIAAPLGRKELAQYMLPCETEGERYFLLAALLRGLVEPHSALIYCATREKVESIRDFLRSIGLDAVAFHAGLDSEVRMQCVVNFRAGKLRIICASTAFGMGIDYPHVERVIYWGLPYDISSYWQGIGRAGRSGKDAQAYILWCRSDVLRLRGLSPRQYEKLRNVWSLFLLNLCRKRAVAQEFGMQEKNCGACDVCWRASNFPLPEMIPDPQYWLRRSLWWLENRADTLAWLDENFSLHRKNLDGTPSHGSV